MENSNNLSEPPPKRQKRKCSVCGEIGHDKRNCTRVPRVNSLNLQENHDNGDESLPRNVPPEPTVNSIDLGEVLYCVFDLETTGFSRERDDIIEISSVLLSPDGILIEDSTFTSFCKPSRVIPAYVTSLTSISNDMVQDSASFADVIEALLKFIDEKIDDYNVNSNKSVPNVILVAHNGSKFDIPFLVSSIRRCQKHNLLNHRLFQNYIDTLELAKRVGQKQRAVPSNFRLNTIYQFITGNNITNAHRAYGDVQATCVLLKHPIFWD